MKHTRWKPIRLPQEDDENRVTWDEETDQLAIDLKNAADFQSDMVARIDSLTRRYDCPPTAEGWRDLALKLAFVHKEAGFDVDVPLPPRSRKEDEVHRRDLMIEAHLNPPGGSTAKPCSSVSEAAKLVEEFLYREWQANGQAGQRPPRRGALAEQFSKRRRRFVDGDELRPIPLFILDYLERLHIFRAAQKAAELLAARNPQRL